MLLTERDKFRQILTEVEKPEAPISVIEKIEVQLKDGTVFSIYVQSLLNEGYDQSELESAINKKLDACDDMIKDVNFYISTDDVASTVQPITNRILKNL